MKLKIYALLSGAVMLMSVNIADASATMNVISKPTVVTVKEPDPLSLMSAAQFLSLTPKKFRQLTGKKMNLVQRIELKILQQKVRKMVKRGDAVSMSDVLKQASDESLMNILGFLLGAILGPIGLIIALILRDSGDLSQAAFRWSLIGCLVWLVIVLFWWVIF